MLQARRTDPLCRRALARRRPHGEGAQARSRHWPPRCGARRFVRHRAPRMPDPGRREHADHELESEVDIHAFAPADLHRSPRRRFHGRDRSRRGACRQLVRVVQPRARGDREPDDVPMWWRSTHSTATCACSGSTSGCSSRGFQPAIFYNLLLTARRPQRQTARMTEHVANDFPLFPLQLVVLPAEVVPLHIFEDRYKTMIDECMTHKSRVRRRLDGRRRTPRDRLRLPRSSGCSRASRTVA